MQLITEPVVWGKIEVLDRIARGVLGDATAGVSLTGEYSAIVLLDDTEQNIAICKKILQGEGVITSITVEPVELNEAEPMIITCNDTSIANDSVVGFAVFLDGLLYDEGVVDVVDGSCALTDPTPDAGNYEVVFYRVIGDYVSGSATMTVAEVV